MSALLPANASDFEKFLSLSTDALGKLGPGADAISRFKSVPGDSVLPFLIWEYGLGEIQPYLIESRRIIHEGLIWQRLRGTPAALRLAFGWLGQEVFIEEDGTGDHWATYQIGLPQIATDEEVRRVMHLARLSQPARCRLWRIYTTAFDRRPIILSEGSVLGDGWLSFYSGIPVDGGGGEDVLVSFGTKDSFQAGRYLPHDVCGSFGTIIHLGILAPYLDRFIVGRSALSWKYARNHGFAVSSLFSILWADRETMKRGWRGMWDARGWREYTGFDRTLPRWSIGRRYISRSQLVPGWGEALSGINARPGASFATLIDNPGRLSLFRLSDHNPERRELRIHEFEIIVGGFVPSPLDPPPPRQTNIACFAFDFPVPPSERAPYCIQSFIGSALAWTGPGLPASGLTTLQPTQSDSLRPCPEAPSAVRTFDAARWSGSWDTPGRDWTTAKEIAVQ